MARLDYWLAEKTGIPIQHITREILYTYKQDVDRIQEALSADNRDKARKEIAALRDKLVTEFNRDRKIDKAIDGYLSKTEQLAKATQDQLDVVQAKLDKLSNIELQKSSIKVNDGFLVAFSKICFYSILGSHIILPPIFGMINGLRNVGDMISGQEDKPLVGMALPSGLYTGVGAAIGDPGNIGPHHIDLKADIDPNKIDDDDAWIPIVEMYDSIAAGYEAEGMRIEFSNATMDKKYNNAAIYDRHAPLAEKIQMLQDADDAHAEHTNGPRDHLAESDYYAAEIGKDRGYQVDKNIPAPILIPNLVGAEVRYDTATNYGAFLTMYKDGVKVLTIGHGDSNKELPENKEL